MPAHLAALLPADPTHELRRAVLEGLRAGRWAPGERLPAERRLCEQFGVGRTVLRRVLREFKEAGWIRQAVGSGTYVVDDLPARLPAPDLTAAVSPAELMAARQLIEPLLVDLVVAQATPADFDTLEECCVRAEAATTAEDFEHWDGALHERIARASHNAVFMGVFELMSTARRHGEWGMLKKKSLTPERRERYQREHRALVEALKDRDAERARGLLHGHLEHVRFNLLGR